MHGFINSFSIHHHISATLHFWTRLPNLKKVKSLGVTNGYNINSVIQLSHDSEGFTKLKGLNVSLKVYSLM